MSLQAVFRGDKEKLKEKEEEKRKEKRKENALDIHNSNFQCISFSRVILPKTNSKKDNSVLTIGS